MSLPAPDTQLQTVAREIFQAALELEPPERETFVAERCGADERLRAEVDSLLSSFERAGGFLEGSVLDAAGAFWVGKRVGEYEILRLIGRGGVGLVFEARQDRPRRAVALKLLRPEFADDEVRRRFDVEAELLALLEHPGIARIYAAGTVDTELGPQSFLAMELIEGRSLLDYVTDERLGARECVQLVASVCEAMQHAHERGVIHRDLKPGNVLVDVAGRPRVLDFGVARATNADLDVETLCTNAGALVGTVSYMSPEQSRGESERLDARTDVYSLGVVLYQLLSGRLPLPVSELPLTEAVRTLGEDEPPPLARVAQGIAEDLATVVDKAIAREPGRRYASAGELGDDLRRWLAGEPVRARPPSVLYQVRKLAARHRGLVTSVSVAVVALVAVAAVATLGAWREAALRARSEEAERDARAAQLESEFEAYAANMAVVESSVVDADVVEARVRLDAVGERFRGWEWYHLDRRLDRSAVVLENGSGVETMELAEDGRTLVTAGTDRVVRSWDLETGELRWATSLGDSFTARGVALDPSGEWVAATLGSWFGGRGGFGPITLLARADGRVVAELEGHTDVVQDVVFHPTEPRLFSASSDGTVRAWDLDRRVEERVIARHERDVQEVAVSPDGRLVASVGWAGRVNLVDAHSLEPVRTFETGERLTVLDWAADGSSLGVGTWNGRVLTVDPESGARRYLEARHKGRVKGMRFVPGGAALMSGGALNSLLRHELPRGVRTDSFLGSTGVVTGIAFETGGRTLLSGGLDGRVRRWASETQDVVRLEPHAEWVYDAAISPDGRRLVTVGSGPTGVQPRASYIHLHDLATRQVERRLAVGGERVLWSAEFAPDGERFATAGSHSGAIVWSASTGERVLELEHPDELRCATFEPSGERLATTGRDRVVRLWNSHTGALEGELAWEERRPFSARFSPDGRALAVGYYDGAVALWDPAAGDLVAGRDGGHEGGAYALAFSPDGRHLVSGGSDGRLVEWETEGLVATGRRLVLPAGVTDLAFLPDASRLFVAGRTDALRVVETESFGPIVSLSGHDTMIRAVAVDPAGRFVVTGGADSDVRVWESGSD